MFVSKSVFDKFSAGTVEALEYEKEKLTKSEKQTQDVLKKYKSRNDTNLKQLELKLEAKTNTLLRGEVQDKFDAFSDDFDLKLRKLNHKVNKISESKKQQNDHQTTNNENKYNCYIGARLETLSKQIFLEMRNLKSELSMLSLHNNDNAVGREPTP